MALNDYQQLLSQIADNMPQQVWDESERFELRRLDWRHQDYARLVLKSLRETFAHARLQTTRPHANQLTNGPEDLTLYLSVCLGTRTLSGSVLLNALAQIPGLSSWYLRSTTEGIGLELIGCPVNPSVPSMDRWTDLE